MVERKVPFISEAGSLGAGVQRADSCPKADSSRLTVSRQELLNFVYLAELDLHCCPRAFSSCGEQRLLSVWGARASHCGDFSCCCWRALGTWASVVMAHRLSCPDACGILVPRPGIEPTSPALAGGFISTGQPASALTTAFVQRIRAFWGFGETPAKAQEAMRTKQIDSDGASAGCTSPVVTGAKMNALGTDLALLSPTAPPRALPVMLALTPSLCTAWRTGALAKRTSGFSLCNML